MGTSLAITTKEMFMKSRLAVFSLLIFVTCSGMAQPPQHDARISGLLQKISADSLEATVRKLAQFGTRHTLSDTVSPIRGIGAAREWIKSTFERFAGNSEGRLTVAFDRSIVQPSKRIPRPTEIVNVIATLSPARASATPATRTIVVSAHYDSRASDIMDSTSDAPGADDDGSGTALVLELARVLSPYEFNTTIVFACFSGEEQGLLGSSAWLRRLQADGMQIVAVLNNDIVGNVVGGDGSAESSYVRIFSEAYSPQDTGFAFQRRNALGLENDGPSRSLARYVKEMGGQYLEAFRGEMIYRLDRFLRGGDHEPFHQAGYAAVRLSEVKENYAHEHQNIRTDSGRALGDLPDFLDWGYLANVARLNAATIASLAWAPDPPAEPTIVTDKLEYVTRLNWKKSRDPDLAGYYVRYRKTASPDWEFSSFTTETNCTLNISKDDYIFGIQSVNSHGDCGLISLPMPSR